MKIKNTFIGFATVVLVLASGLPLSAAADEVIEVDLRFAGAFVAGGILHVDLNPASPPGSTVVSALIHAQAKGKPGKAVIRGFGGMDAAPDFTFDCLGIPGPSLLIPIVENPLVITFEDLSLLFAKGGSGRVCVDVLNTQRVEFEIDITFMGGRGKYEGASGQAVIRGEGEPVSADGSFVGETGTIVGWFVVPDDDDDSDSDD